MAAARKTPKKDARIYVEILQNGEPVAAISHPVRRRKRISFGAKKGDLRIPHYPLSDPMEIFEIDRQGMYLLPHTQSEGFLKTKGQIKPIVAHSKENLQRITIREGDYGSVSYRDLKVLFRVGQDNLRKPPPIPAIANKYHGSFLGFWAMSRWETWGFLAALLATLMIFGGLLTGLLQRQVHSFRSILDLGTVYKLPFVAASHIETLPEALQTKLVRNDLLNQSISYYHELAKILAGEETPKPRLTEASTAELYSRFTEAQTESIEKKQTAQRQRENALLGEPGTAIISLPAVRGETLVGRILRVQDKIAIQHDAMKTSLLARRDATAEYNTDHEIAYDFANYRDPKKAAEKKKEVREALGKIKPFVLMTDEEAMYSEAKKLSEQAAASQKRLLLNLQKQQNLTPQVASPLTLAADVSFASFLPRSDYSEFNRKLAYLQASEYGVTKKARQVKEPLIGRLDPRLIEKVIAARRFELQLCYELALRRDQALAGNMEWQWRLDSRGQLSDLRLLSSSIRDSLMVDCVRGKISRWKFPRPDRGSVEVQYPFSFKKIRG